MARARVVLLLFFFFSLGCDTRGGTDAGPDAMVPTARIELGTGTSAFEPIAETGGELELVGGPQGGFHVFITARFFELDPEGMRLRFDAINVDTGANVGTPAIFSLVLARVQREGDHFVRAGDILILDDGNPDNVRGLMLDVTVTAEEAGTGRSATDHRVVRIVDDVSG